MLKYQFNIIVFFILIIFISVNTTHGHGMMLDPVSRSSRWRYDKTAPINYDDNGLFCGGFGVQWFSNNGKCGLCGDDFAASRPRENELGGKFGKGVITGEYFQSQNPRLGIKVTTNHLGFFYFDICNLDKFQVESEACFSANKIMFADGSFKMYIGTSFGMIYPTIILPKGLNCKHCVLRWNYQAGNNWGPCGNGTSALGCGPQENFKGCSDIRIRTKNSRTKIDLQRKLFQKFINKNEYSDYDVNFLPRDYVQPNQLKDFFFYKTYNHIDDNIDAFKSERDEKRVPSIFEEAENNGVDNINYDSAEKEEVFPYFDKNVIHKEDEIFEKKEIPDGFDAALFEVPEFKKEDQLDTEIEPSLNTLNDMFAFDHDELRDNVLDDGFKDFEGF